MLLLLLSAAALAPQAGDAAKPTPVKEKKICMSESQTGSLFSREVCHTKAEWKEINDANRAAVEQSRQVNATAR